MIASIGDSVWISVPNEVWIQSPELMALVKTCNYKYNKFEFEQGTLLSISRIDEEKMDFQEIQNVKSRILGDVDCIMLFPKRKDSIDNANEYHLIIYNDMKLHFGLHNYENLKIINHEYGNI